MKSKNFFPLLGMVALTVALSVLPGAAGAEMYVEGYLGGAAAANFQSSSNTNINLGVTPAVIGGLKIGTWFVPTGFLGYQYPDWMKYLGFYTDFSYQRLDVRQQQLGSGFFHIKSEGSVATWAFMLAGRYGFFQDSEVPFGRLQPYFAFGPAVMFSSRDLKFLPGNALGSASSVDIAATAEAGVRYMMLKNVSMDLSFKYRFASPRFVCDGFDWRPDYNLFSGQVGVAYHF